AAGEVALDDGAGAQQLLELALQPAEVRALDARDARPQLLELELQARPFAGRILRRSARGPGGIDELVGTGGIELDGGAMLGGKRGVQALSRLAPELEALRRRAQSVERGRRSLAGPGGVGQLLLGPFARLDQRGDAHLELLPPRQFGRPLRLRRLAA